MARISRIIVPGYPHHITQRGVRSMDVFNSDEDRQGYLLFLSKEANRFGLDILAWRLMTNHIHFIAVPHNKTPFARGVGEAHSRHTRMKNLAQEFASICSREDSVQAYSTKTICWRKSAM